MEVGVFDVGRQPEDTRERWRWAVVLVERYQMNRSGITYAMQGLHTGDGVTLPHGVVRTHTTIDTIYNEVVKAHGTKQT